MRNKRLFVLITVMLLIAFVLSMTLMACKKRGSDDEDNKSGEVLPPPDDKDDDDEDNKPTEPSKPAYAKSFMKAMEYITGTMPSEFMSLNFVGKVTLSGKKYDMSVKGNLSDDDVQLSLVFKPEGTGSVAFAMYAVDSKVFVETQSGIIYNIAEIDVDYLASIIDKLPGVIDGALGGILEEYEGLINFALNLLLGGFAPSSKITYSEDNGVEKFGFAIDVQGLLKPIGSVLSAFKDVLGDIDLSLVNDLISVVPLINGSINATVSNSVLTEFSVELLDNDPNNETYGQPMLGFDSAINFSNKPIEIDLPDGLDTYQSLTLGNLSADFTMTLDTGGQPFDIGKLVDEVLVKFVPSITEPIFGEGQLTLDGNAEYSLDVRAALDPNLDGKDEDNNYFNVVLRAGENELARVNYLDGKLYIKALADGVNGFAEGGINVAIPLDLKGYISQLVKLVTDAIDKALGTEFKPELEAGAIVTASIARDGEVILSPSLQSAIVKILKIIGLEEYIIPSGDRITILINNEFIKAICDLAKIEPIELPIFGDLTIGLFGGGIEYVELQAMDVLTLRADNFLIGMAKITRQDVLDSIGDVNNYGENIEQIIKSFALSLLSDLDVSIALDLSTVDSTVNLTPIINNVMAVAGQSTYLKMPIALDLSNYDGIFKVRIASRYTEEDNIGRLMLEVITPNGDTLLGVYNEKDRTYIDLSGLGFMKFCLTNVNLFDMIRGQLLGDTLNEDDLQEAAAMMSMSNSSNVEIGSDHIGAYINSYLVTTILRMLGMDLGLDVELDAQINFDGSIDLGLALGEMVDLGLSMSLGKESQSEIKIVDAIERLAKGEFGEYNAVDAEMLVDSILVAQNLNLTLDLYNNNVDAHTHDNKTRIFIRKSTATAPGLTERLDNGMLAPYKSIVLTIYAGWTNTTSEALLFGYIDVDGKKVNIQLAKKALEGVKVLGIPITDGLKDTIINQIKIPIDVDIKGLLVGALGGLFGDSSESENENFGGAIDVPEGALPEQKPSVEVNDPAETASIEAKDTAATPTIDEMIDMITLKLSGSLDVDVDVDFNGAVLSNLLTNLLKGVFTEMNLESMTGDATPVTINYDNKNPGVFSSELYNKLIEPLLKKQVGNLSGLLGGVNLQDVLANIIKRFLPLSDFADLTANVSLTDGKLANISVIASNEGGIDDYGFGLYIFNRKADEVISWENQATDIYFNPTFGGNLVDMFETRARKHTVSNWEVDSWQNITWTLKGSETDLATFYANIADYEDGEYIFVGKAWDNTIEVKVTLHRAEIESIKDIQVKAMRDIPTYVTAVFTDGTERLITDVSIVCDGRVNAENNASVTIGGNTYTFTIDFEGEVLAIDSLVLNAYDYLDKITALENSGIAKVKVNDTFYRNLPATYDFSAIKAMSRQELQKPNTYNVNVRVGEGTPYQCDLVLKVEFTPFEIYYIERNGLNYIETDFIEYSKGESFPSEITVVGYNGKEKLKYTAKVSEWDLDGVTIDLKGGQYFASAILNKGEYNEWRMEAIEVDVLSTDIVDLTESSKSVVFDWKYYFYGNVPIDRVLPSLLDFTTSDGTIKKNVPVTIDISQIFADEATIRKAMAEGMTFECPVSVDVVNDGKPLFVSTVKVTVPAINMSLTETEINIDYADYMKYGKSVFFRDNIAIMLGSDKVDANVTWFTDEVVFNKNGTYTAIVYLDQNGPYEQSCEVTVNITGAPTAREV